MKIRGFVLGVILLALVGWCMVQESFRQTRARYQLAELARKEDNARKRLGKLKAQEEELRSPARLAALVREKRMELVSLGSSVPQQAAARKDRRPGEVLDRDLLDLEWAARDEVASVGQW